MFAHSSVGKEIVAVLTLLLLPSAAVLGADQLPGAAVSGDSSQERTVVIDEEVFALQHIGKTSSEVINEYLPLGEDLLSWSKMIAVHLFVFDREISPSHAASITAETLKDDPDLVWGPRLQGQPSRQRYILEFAVASTDRPIVDPQEFVEYNVFIYEGAPSWGGTILNQFAMRAYGTDTERFTAEIPRLRAEWQPKVLEFDFPVVLLSESDAGEPPDPVTEQPTPGVKLKLRRSQTNFCHLVVQGVPAGQRFFVWMKGMDRLPKDLGMEFVVDSAGVLQPIANGETADAGFYFRSSTYLPGEPMSFSIRSVDRSIVAYAEWVPFPLEAESPTGKRISMVLQRSREYKVTVHGFEPGESVQLSGKGGLIKHDALPLPRYSARFTIPENGVLTCRWIVSPAAWDGAEATLEATGQEGTVQIRFQVRNPPSAARHAA